MRSLDRPGAREPFGSSFDTILEVRLDSAGAVPGCNDDNGGGLQSSGAARATSGEVEAGAGSDPRTYCG
jgi:hypothetical protein